MEDRNVVYKQSYPEFAGRLTSPVKVSDFSGEHSFQGKLLWDTGAEISVISKCVAEACRIDTIPAGTMRSLVYEPSEMRYGVVLMFPGDIRKFVPMQAAVLNEMYTDIDVILGMDVIGRGDFALIRKEGMLELRFAFGKDFLSAK